MTYAILFLAPTTLEKPTFYWRWLELIVVSSTHARHLLARSSTATRWSFNTTELSWRGHKMTCMPLTASLGKFTSRSGKVATAQRLSMQCKKITCRVHQVTSRTFSCCTTQLTYSSLQSNHQTLRYLTLILHSVPGFFSLSTMYILCTCIPMYMYS